jgi:TonB family protein
MHGRAAIADSFRETAKMSRQEFCLSVAGIVSPNSAEHVYSAAEIARASGASTSDAAAVLGNARYVSHADAVKVGRALRRARVDGVSRRDIFSVFQPARSGNSRDASLALSSMLYAGLFFLVIVMTSAGTPSKAAVLHLADGAGDPMRLVFLATPGPGGGGGGGGARQPQPASEALREGDRKVSSPVVVQQPAPAPLQTETLPVLMAPVVSAPADARTRAGVLEQTTVDVESQGPGADRGAGTAAGGGLGAGTGNGIGPGSGGGTGGGPYRAGSGVEPPRLLHEVKADYTEEARQRGLSGDVVLEIVVRRDGSVADVRILQGLGGGLNERAVDAVRQWTFAPARRLGTPVDVIVEVAVEFKLR